MTAVFGDSRLPLRFWKATSLEPSGCWVRKPNPRRGGYASFGVKVDGGWRNRSAHRVTFEAFVGPIAAGADIDHLCRVRACCNPEHLEPVTRRINLARGNGPAETRARALEVTHCPAGHSYAEHGRRTSRGSRNCRICARAATARYRQRKEAAR